MITNESVVPRGGGGGPIERLASYTLCLSIFVMKNETEWNGMAFWMLWNSFQIDEFIYLLIGRACWLLRVGIIWIQYPHTEYE